MAIIQKLTEEELALAEIMRHPLWFGEFIREFDDENWEYTDYQKEVICDFNNYVVLRCGRAIGKTVSIVDKLTWYAVNDFWGEPISYTVPSKTHMEPVFFGLSRWFRVHPFLKYYTGRSGINFQNFNIKLNNGGMIDCRIAGQSNTGQNVVGMHVPVIVLDEAGLYPWGTWLELLPCLNLWCEGHQLVVSGVPIGNREKNVLYFTDQMDDKFTKHRIPAHRNPRYSASDEERNIKQFGGADSEDYIHIVLGEHGSAAYSLFDRSKMEIERYEVWRGTISGQKINEDKTALTRLLNSLPHLPKKFHSLYFGVDLGYTEPTVIVVLYRTYEDSPWKILMRLTLRQVEYVTQEFILDSLDTLYEGKAILGIDEGSSGKAVLHHLMNDPKYARKRYKDRIVPVAFRSTIPVGIDENGDKVEVRAKQFGMQMLQSMSNNHDIVYTDLDEELISELEHTTYTRTATGELIFRTITSRGGLRHAEDHNLSALVCFVIAYYLKEQVDNLFTNTRPKLYSPRWV